MQQNTDSSQAATNAIAAMGATGILIFVLVCLALFVLQLVICWKIAAKAGYQGALSLLMLVPLVNFVIILIFAFSEWPIESRLKALTGGTTTHFTPTA